MKPTDLQEAQTEYMAAKVENEYIKTLAAEANEADYKKLDESQDKEEIQSLKNNIYRRNGEIGLYNSNSRLSVAEDLLFKAAKNQIKQYCTDNGELSKFEYLDKNLFQSKMIEISSIRRQELINLCMKVKA